MKWVLRRGSPVVGGCCGAVFALFAFGCGGSDGGESPPTGPPPVAPVIIEQPQSRSVLSGTLATFSVTVTGSSPITYQWMEGSLALNNNGPILQVEASYDYDRPERSFRVVVSNAAGSVSSNNATLRALPFPPGFIEQPQSVSVAVGTIAQFRVVMSGHPKFFCQWERSDNGGATWRAVEDLVSECNVLPSSIDVYLTPPTTLADSGAQFRVRVSNASGEVISQIATLTVM